VTDQEHGKADTKRGYAKVASQLLEALACAPLSGSEFQVVCFIIRRTYGWANANDPDRGKLDVMTAKDIARGTGLTDFTAARSLNNLVRENVVCMIPLAEYPGCKCAYGINTMVSEWYGGPEWRESKVALKQAQEAGSYTQNSAVPIPEKVYWQYTKKCSGNTDKCVVLPDLKPTAAIVPGALHIDSTDILTERESDSPTPTSSSQASERLYGERDIDEEERKLQADIRSKKAEALDKEKQKRLILADKVSRLTNRGKRLFDEIVEYMTEVRGGRLFTTNQQIGTVDWVRDKVGAHGEDAVERFVTKAIAAQVNDVTSYVSACFRGNVGQSNGASVGKPAAGTGGNRKSLVVDPLGPWHDAEYDELCKSLKRAEEEKNYDEQQRLMTLIAQKEAPYTHL
jgi:phage replication O-like protein O